MTSPLALVLYETVLPGSQIVIRLQDLGYRVQTLANAKELVEHAEAEKPIIVVLDLVSQTTDVSAAIKQLKDRPSTRHIPILAYLSQDNPSLQAAAQAAGAELVANDSAIIAHLPQLLDQALHVE
jgi:CheY-like chemotaxis protein